MREGHRLDEVLLEARLDRGLDLLDPPDDALDLGRAAPLDSRAISAPVPAALPADRTCAEVAVGIEPEDHRVERVDLAAERAGQADLVDASRSPSWSISSRTPAYSAALASWIARTSFWVMAIRGPARRPVGRRGGRS